MQYSIVGNDIALIMHYHALRKRSDFTDIVEQKQNKFCNWDTPMHQILGPKENWFLAHYLIINVDI